MKKKPNFKLIYTHFRSFNHFSKNPSGPSIFILNLHHSFKKQNPKILSSHLHPHTPHPKAPFFLFLLFSLLCFPFFLFFPHFFSYSSSSPPLITFFFLSFSLSLTIPMPTLSSDHLTINKNSSMTANCQPTIITFLPSFYLSLMEKNGYVVNRLVH